MSGKLVFLLLALSCVAQGYDSRAPRSDAETRLTIDDIVKALNELVSKLREALGGLGDLIQDLQKRIKDIISSIDLPGILADIQKRIEDIIKAAGIEASAAATCLKAEKEAVQELASTIGNGVTECVKLFDPVLNKIQGEIHVITNEASKLISEITGGIAKCFKDNGLNPIKLLDCVKGLVEPSTAKVDALLAKIKKVIEDGQVLIEDTAAQLGTCVEGVAKEANDKKDAIIGQFQKCVDEIVG